MLSRLKTLGKIAGRILLYLVGFDIAGVLVCLLLDVVSFGDSNTLESYAVWFVLGSLCGLFSYNTAGRVASPKSKADGTNQRETRERDGARPRRGKPQELHWLLPFISKAVRHISVREVFLEDRCRR